MQVRRWPAALRWGGIFGGAAALLAAAHEVLAGLVLPQSLAVTLLSAVVFFLACLMVFFAAGALAARATSRVWSGTLAGLFAALIGGAATVLAAIIHTVLQRGTESQPAGAMAVSPVQYTLELAAGAAGLFLAVLILFLIFGAGFGALGGVAGRPVAAVPPSGTSYPPAAYPGAVGGVPVFAAPLDAPTIATAEPADAEPADAEPADAEPAIHVGALPDGEATTE